VDDTEANINATSAEGMTAAVASTEDLVRRADHAIYGAP